MAICVICQKDLTIQLTDGDENRITVDSNEDSCIDDDVHLPCCCHFHWQCLLDTIYEVTSCPNCKKNLINVDPNGNQQLLCNLKNEGGLQKAHDILPILSEELYLKAYPEDRKSRAFLEFCAEGDIEAISDMLNTENEFDEEDEESATSSNRVNKDILRYQDQLGSMKSALHVAIQNQRVEVAWLLLLLASTVDPSAFPNEVITAARNMGIVRGDQNGKIDIRSLRDAEGMTAYERARDIGGIWESWVREGAFMREPLLRMP